MRLQAKNHFAAAIAALLMPLLLLTSAEAIEVAGELFVDLRANDASAGGASWNNSGTLGGFAEVGDPRAVIVPGGVPAVYFDGVDDAYQSAVGAPAGLTGLDPTRTIEAWVLNPSIPDEETVVSWGHRGGPDGSNMSFNYGQHGAFGAVGHWGGSDIGWVDAGGAPAPMQWHHLAYTFDGSTTRVYADGVLQNSEVVGAGVINTHPNTKITVASQLEADGVTLTGGLKGNLAIGGLRIHDGVLSDTQILANWTEEVGGYPNPPAPPIPTPKPLQTGPNHRYSFSNPAADATNGVLEDSVGGAHGVVLGAGGSFTGTRLNLPGGSSATQAYGDLPNGLISSLTDATLEAWITVDGSQNWGRVFDFGSSDIGGGVGGEVIGPGGGGEGRDYLALTASRGTNIDQQRLELRNEDPAGGGITTIDANTVTPLGQAIHVAVVYDSDGGFFGEPVLRYYRDGVLENEGTTAIKLSDVHDVNNWLGRSNWTGDANLQGSYDEFRIYDRALTHDEVLGNMGAGPDVVNVVPEPAFLSVLAAISFGVIASRLIRRR
jgi:hypothetical protein